MTSKKKCGVPDGLVKHPRFGTAVRPSGFEVDVDIVRKSFWRYRSEVIFPETAIPANLQKQSYATIPCGWYVDVLKNCRSCRRKFIFYAVEQRHWYEVLKFKLDADCVRCPECRKTDQTLRRRFQRFSKAVQRTDLSDSELEILVRDAVFLWDNGLLSKREKLNRIRNLSRRRIPNCQATRVIEILTAGLDSREGRQ